LIPVCASRQGGEPLFRLPGSNEATLPHLGYSAGSFLRRAVDHILDQKEPQPALRLCYENVLADALKSMALAEHGLAWLPEGLAEPDLERRRLVRAGGPEWELPLEIRLYKAAAGRRPEAAVLWSSL
jgi:DNA-binding transcriptional LysR family regulator